MLEAAKKGGKKGGGDHKSEKYKKSQEKIKGEANLPHLRSPAPEESIMSETKPKPEEPEPSKPAQRFF